MAVCFWKGASMNRPAHFVQVKPTIKEIEKRLVALDEMQRILRVGMVLEADFIRERVQKLQDLAAVADPFIKKRLLRLAHDYERRLKENPRPPAKLAGSETKPPSER